MLKEALNRLLGRPEFQLPLETSVPQTVELEAPELLCLSLCPGGVKPLKLAVEKDEEVSAGDVLARDGEKHLLPSPFPGTIAAITEQPDIRGNRKGGAVLLRPSKEADARAFEKLDPEKADVESLRKRIREAGILSTTRTPRPLLDQLCPEGDSPVETLVVLAADRDPGVTATLQLLRERLADAPAAARLLGRIAAAGKVVLAVLESEASALAAGAGLELLPLQQEYPQTLVGMVTRKLGGAGTLVIPLDSALAALDAVRDGLVQREKWLTLIGPDQQPIANYRVQLGTPIGDVLRHAGLEPTDRDKVVAGGPMRGRAVYSVSGAVDAGVDALTIVPADSFPRWTTDPCINCGRCIDRCPVDLQVQLIARYAEFGFFDRTVEYGIDQCFECGLCASVCTARRPLMQYIRLAKEELEASA